MPAFTGNTGLFTSNYRRQGENYQHLGNEMEWNVADMGTTKKKLIRINLVSESFDSTQLMTHNGFTGIYSNQFTTQNGFLKIDSNQLTTQKAPRIF